MAISEQSRHQLYRRLEQVLGPDEAAVLMEHLPPVGWADVATKRDIEGLRHEMERQSDRFSAKLERELRLQTWRFVTVTLAAVAAVGVGAHF